ncbi:recombinase family protein [Nitrospira sp. Nam74]
MTNFTSYVSAEHASIVKRVFYLYRRGLGITSIRNEIRASCPSCHIDNATIRRILRRQFYRGRIIRHRTKYRRDPITGLRIKTASSPEDWLVRMTDLISRGGKAQHEE